MCGGAGLDLLGPCGEHTMQMHETAQPGAKTMRNQRKMQGTDQLQKHQAERNDASKGMNAVNGALGHFAEGRYP